MSKKTLMELTQIVAKRYLKAIWRIGKSKILDEYCANSQLNRKYAITKIREICFKNKDPSKDWRWKKKEYSNEAFSLLIDVWQAYDCICWERFHPFIKEWLNKLEQFWYLNPNNKIKVELLKMSLSTVKRAISIHKKNNENEKSKFSTTKPWSLLKHQIPIRLSSQWHEDKPWYWEIDLVAHCWWSLSWDFINTLQYVDINTTWTERWAIMWKWQERTFKSLQKIKSQLPFRLNGIDSDNWWEFINYHLVKYCEDNNIAFTRSRPGQSKDNAHIEQKNYTLVRKVLWYDRFDTDEHLRLINDLYDNELRLFLNFFQPCLKLNKKIRIWSKYKRTYDEAKTPYQRVLESEHIPETTKERLKEIYKNLDPIKLKKSIDSKVMKIIKLTTKN
jgi:hypothetical protein